MSASRHVVIKKVIDAGLMEATITSSIVSLKGLDNVAVAVNASAGATGTITVEFSLNYDEQLLTGDWIAQTLSPSGALSGSALIATYKFPAESNMYARVKYTFTSGTGTLNAWIGGKGV